MAKPKDKKKQTIKPAGKKDKSELSDKDLGKASGGLNPQPLPPRYLPT